VIDIVELYQHWHAGRRIGELSSSLGVDPKTIRKYTAPALAAGIVPGGPPLSAQEWSTLAEGWFPGAADRSRRQSSWSDIEPHRKRIEGWLGEVTVSTIHQRLRDDHGLSASQSSLRRYLLANFAEEVARSAVTVLRETPPAGDEILLAGGMVDLDALAALHPRARLAVRAQPGQADLAGEAHIRGAIAEGHHLVEEG
jgi:hypothetical protein